MRSAQNLFCVYGDVYVTLETLHGQILRPCWLRY